jgi:hypothetical protein
MLERVITKLLSLKHNAISSRCQVNPSIILTKMSIYIYIYIYYHYGFQEGNQQFDAIFALDFAPSCSLLDHSYIVGMLYILFLLTFYTKLLFSYYFFTFFLVVEAHLVIFAYYQLEPNFLLPIIFFFMKLRIYKYRKQEQRSRG